MRGAQCLRWRDEPYGWGGEDRRGDTCRGDVCEEGAERHLYGLRQASLLSRKEGGGGRGTHVVNVFADLGNELLAALIVPREPGVWLVGLVEGDESERGAGKGGEAANVLECALAVKERRWTGWGCFLLSLSCVFDQLFETSLYHVFWPGHILSGRSGRESPHKILSQ